MPAVFAETEELKPWALRELPVFPPITTKLLQLLSNDDAQVKKLVDLLRSDAAFSAELLRRANSAMYGLRSQVSSLQHAVMLLGFDNMKALALAASMGSYIKPALRLAALRQCWRHSLATAMVAESIAKALQVDCDRAYTAGMLHDIGMLGLMVNYPEAYANLIIVSKEHEFDMRETERAQFDVDHCEAGAWLANQWNFPPEIEQVARSHHDRPAEGDTSLTSIVYWSSLLADAAGYDLKGTSPCSAYDEWKASMPYNMAKALPEKAHELAAHIKSKVDGLE